MDKTVYMNMSNSYPTRMYESSFAQMYVFRLLIVFMVGDLTSSVRRNCLFDSNIPLIHCSQSTVCHVQVDSFA